MGKLKKITLVDGSSYLYRAFHALPPLTGPQEEPTGVLYGVMNMLRRLLVGRKPDYFAVVFDPKGKTFRHELYPQYKANRPPMPEDLSRQVPHLFELIKASGYPLVQVAGFEADDVIGTIASRARDRQVEVLISTGDKDFAQLVRDGVTLINTMKGERLDSAGVVAKMGVSPDQVVDYLALTGDKSDNIPGVSGVGPKTAVKWLAQYPTLDDVIEHAAEIKGRAGENLRRVIDVLPLSRELATIRCDLDIAAEFSDFEFKTPDIGELHRLYARFGFKKWIEELGSGQSTTSVLTDGTQGERSLGGYRLILDKKGFDSWLEKLAGAGGFALGVATDKPDYMQARLVGISFALAPEETAYIPLGHNYEGALTQLPQDQVLGALRPLLEDPMVDKTGHHLKYACNVLANHGVHLRGIRYDPMLESYVHNSVASRHDLDSLAGKYLGVATTQYEQIAGKGVRQKPFNQVHIEPASRYAAESTGLSLRLHGYFWAELEKDEVRKKIYEEIEIPLVPVLSDIERCGVFVDVPALTAQSADLKKRIDELRTRTHKAAGSDFNLDSPVQIREILFENHGLPVLKKTPKGQPSTAEDVLHELAQDFELPRLILDYRMISKLKSTYTDKLPHMVNPDSGRIHTTYHQAVTATGRLSSSDPNLQNIPVRTPEGRLIRRAFKAPSGCRLLAADYSQIELRIMAHLSGDECLCRAFEAEEDIHAATAAEIFAVPLKSVTPVQRRSAKAINFGLIYGMSAFGLARQLGLDFASAKQYMSMYFERYPGVQAYMDQARRKARDMGYAETLFGRRLYLPEIRSPAVHRRQYAERTAINAPVQGSAADIMKKAMINLHQRLSEYDARIVLQVHDELLIEVAEGDVKQVAEVCRACMGGAALLKVPLLVIIGGGYNWDEAH